MTITTTAHDSDLGPVMECHWEAEATSDYRADLDWLERLEDLGNVESVRTVIVADEDFEGIAIRQELGGDVVLEPGDRFIIAGGSVARR